MIPMRYGTKPGHFETSIIHFPTSEGVIEVSERCERTSKRMSEWPSTYVTILVCFRPQCDGKDEKKRLFNSLKSKKNNEKKRQEIETSMGWNE